MPIDPLIFSNVKHMLLARGFVEAKLRLTEVTGAALTSLLVLRCVDRMHGAGFSCEVFLSGSCEQKSIC